MTYWYFVVYVKLIELTWIRFPAAIGVMICDKFDRQKKKEDKNWCFFAYYIELTCKRTSTKGILTKKIVKLITLPIFIIALDLNWLPQGMIIIISGAFTAFVKSTHIMQLLHICNFFFMVWSIAEPVIYKQLVFFQILLTRQKTRCFCSLAPVLFLRQF